MSENDLVPLTRAALLDERVAFESVVTTATVSEAELTMFQLASTALTVRLTVVPAVWAVGVPVLPEVVPGAAVSPGRRTCSFVKAPALTVMAGLVLAVRAVLVTSEAVRVADPLFEKVTVNDLVPATKAAFGGRVAVESLDVMEMVSVDDTRFQLASTALTVMANALPAGWEAGPPVLPVGLPGEVVSPGTRS